MCFQKSFKNLTKEIFVFFVVFATILAMIGTPFSLFKPKVVFAQDTEAPQMGHFPVSVAEGSSSAASTLELIVFAGDDQATPGGTPNLTVNAYYSNDGTTWSSAVACTAVATGAPLFKCTLTDAIAAGASSPRNFYYILEAYDGTNYFYLPSGDSTKSNSQNNPFVVSIYNSPSWTNTIAGTQGGWTGVKDGRCFPLSQDAASGASTIYLDDVSIFAANDWIMIDTQDPLQERKQISSVDSNNNSLTLTSATTNAHSTGACVHKFIQGATVWIDGTGINTTTAADGTFTLSNVPDGAWDVVAFKDGYCDIRQPGINVVSGQSQQLDFFLPYGNCKIEKGGVVWTAPMDGMMEAPRDISAATGQVMFPIIIAFDRQMDQSTVSTSTVLLLKEQYNASTDTYELASSGISYSVVYDDGNPSNGMPFNFDFGPDPKIILYTAPGTLLDGNTWYTVKITNGLKDTEGNPLPEGEYIFGFSTSGEVSSADIP
jgi:hypothetical protein